MSKTIPENQPPTGSPRAFWVGLALMAASSFALIALAIVQSGWTATAAAVLSLLVMGLGAALLLYTFNASRAAAAVQYESEEMVRLLVSGVTDYAIYMLDPKGMVTSWNKGAERIKGYSADEIIGWHFSRFYTEEDRLRGAPDHALQTAERAGKYESEGVRVRKDGTTFHAHVAIAPLRNRAGRLVGFAKITRDVSERVQHEAALEQTRTALAQAQKMEALGQLTGGIAHDFNNLLTVIKGSIEILDRRLKAGDHDVTRFIDSARRGADRAAGLTQRLLAFARRQPLELKALNPNKLVAGMVELLHRSLGEGVSIETVLAGGLWWTSTDSNQLEASLLNLAVNARDAMPAGGRLTIETANTYLDEAYADTHEDVVPGQYVMIAVSDTGTGIPKEIIGNIFDPFFTTKDTGKGTGLGLSQVYGFVKQSRGHIMIYSELGEGTTVKIYLPRLEELPAADNSLPVPRVPSSAPNRETLLVVEDDEDVRAFTVATLGELGYRVLEAPDAKAAQALLADGEPIDLLFTDVGLPNGVNGRQLADAAKRDRPQLKVLFTTGYARNAIVHHGRLDPGVELLGKPYTQAQLAQRVRKLLDA